MPTQSAMDDIRVFSGSAHRALAQEICSHIQVPLLPSITDHFSNDCLFVHLNESVREKRVFIVQSLSAPVSFASFLARVTTLVTCSQR